MSISTLYTAEVLRMDKLKEQAAREERVRKSLVEFIDKVAKELFPNKACWITDRDYVMDIIELFVTKRRKWL